MGKIFQLSHIYRKVTNVVAVHNLESLRRNSSRCSGGTGSDSDYSSNNDWDGPCTCCTMSHYYKCGLEAVERESNDNYCRQYVRCPKRVSNTLLSCILRVHVWYFIWHHVYQFMCYNGNGDNTYYTVFHICCVVGWDCKWFLWLCGRWVHPTLDEGHWWVSGWAYWDLRRNSYIS